MRHLVVIACVALGLAAWTAGASAKAPPPKILKAPANVTAEATGPSGAKVSYKPARVSAGAKVTYSRASGATFRLGTTVVVVTAKSAGGQAKAQFKVSVVDTTAPRLAALADRTVQATSPSGAHVEYDTPTATDLVDGSVPATCSPASGSLFPLGSTTVGCSATDRAGNKGTRSFAVKVTPRPNSDPAFPSPQSTDSSTHYSYDTNGRLVGVTTTITLSPGATDPDGDSLTYSWTATNGTITGNGLNATWQRYLIGGRVQAGDVTVTASDGHGGSATFTIRFR